MKLSSELTKFKSYIAKTDFSFDFIKNVTATLSSFVFFCLTGIVLNFGIYYYYGTEELGIFNQVYTLYMILSQLANLGIFASILKYSSKYSTVEELQREGLVLPAMLLNLVATLIFTFILFYNSGWVFYLFSSTRVEYGWNLCLIGFVFYSLNKSLYALLNGRRKFISYAVAHSSRYIMILLGFTVVLTQTIEPKYLPYIFTIPEIFIFISLTLVNIDVMSINKDKFIYWLTEHFRFGNYSLIGYLVSEINIKVDMLMLGIMTTDHLVGLYSIPAMCVEGLFLLITPIRDVINPRFTELFYKSKQDIADNTEFKDYVKLVKKNVWMFMFVMCFVSIFVFAFIMNMLASDLENYYISIYVYLILLIGLVLSSGYQVFNMMLSQIGLPAQNTIFRTIIVMINISLNIVLIPVFGIYGAAMATMCSYVCSIFIIKSFTRYKIGIAL